MPETESTDERADRVREAAADLFATYGYDKTTVSEVAEAAGVSKGTVYLHFDSKKELFEAVLTAELAAYGRRWVELVEDDPEGGTIGGMYKNILYAIEEHEFIAAMLKKDERILGSYRKEPDSLVHQGHNSSDREEFVRRMQEAGAMRDELEPEIIAHLMNLLSYGLVAIGDVMEADNIPPTEAVIEGIGVLLDRALTPDELEDPEVGKRILREEVASSTREMRDEVESDSE